MAEIKVLYKIPPTPISLAYLCEDELLYQSYRNRVWYRAGIRFKGVAATQTRGERFSIYYGDAPDTLIEILDSPWIAEVRQGTQPGSWDHWEMHHYVINVEGDVEVIADSWELIPEEPGKWREE